MRFLCLRLGQVGAEPLACKERAGATAGTHRRGWDAPAREDEATGTKRRWQALGEVAAGVVGRRTVRMISFFLL